MAFSPRILSGSKLESEFDVGFLYSMDSGLSFTGSSTLEIQLPLHFSLGPIEVSADIKCRFKRIADSR